MTLKEIGQKHKTDKCDGLHSAFSTSFLDIYHELFKNVRNDQFTIVELGIKDGASLRTWAEYFPNAEIVGVDIDGNARQHASDRIKVIISDQKNPELPKLIGKRPKIIIDDASHVNELTLQSFHLLWPELETNGFYIMEDMHCSYFNIEPFLSAWPGMGYNERRGTNYDNSQTRKQLDDLFVKTIREMDAFGPMPSQMKTGDVKALRFYPMMTVFEKA